MLPEIIYFLPNKNKNTITVHNFHKDFITFACFMAIPSPVLWTYIYGEITLYKTFHTILYMWQFNQFGLSFHVT
jgi:hypothetical protein